MKTIFEKYKNTPSLHLFDTTWEEHKYNPLTTPTFKPTNEPNYETHQELNCTITLHSKTMFTDSPTHKKI